jgi:CubicO group peptidase (beta-lactamase class C family)
MKFMVVVVMFCLPFASMAADQKEDNAKPAQSISELQAQLEKILQEMHVPGMSIAIVRRDGPEWTAGLGHANLAANQPATDETLFRIGSVSKGFASLSILKLVNEGRLSLQDPVRKLVPEIWFENRWEATDPVRLVDLLEHTTGWDDMHFHEYAKNAKGMTLREGLDYYHGSRISRWRPGTRMAYCNSGPPVAAYIVEKVTGQRFEDYVTQNLFLPIGMKTATYFEQPSPQLTTLYQTDGKTPNSYWNILERPAGAINASAADMAAYVEFLLNRGSAGGVEILPSASIDRMETPTRTWAAQEGLKAGYGLGNYTGIYDGFVFHGHNGGVNGGLTEMNYIPGDGVGYFFSINAGNGEAFGKISDAVRAYVTRGLTRPNVPVATQLPANAHQYAGWYEPASPRNEFMHFLERLGLHRLHFKNNDLMFSNLTGKVNQAFVPVDGEFFRYLPSAGPAEPIATAALLQPNAEGRFVEIGGTWKQIPGWLAIAEIAISLWFLLSIFLILIYAPFWILGGLIKKRRRLAERAMRVWPLLAVLSLIASLRLFLQAGDGLGELTPWSFGLFLSSLIFGVASLAGAGALILARRHEVRGSVFWFSTAVIIPLVIATVYFAYWGAIGVRTWA